MYAFCSFIHVIVVLVIIVRYVLKVVNMRVVQFVYSFLYDREVQFLYISDIVSCLGSVSKLYNWEGLKFNLWDLSLLPFFWKEEKKKDICCPHISIHRTSGFPIFCVMWNCQIYLPIRERGESRIYIQCVSLDSASLVLLSWNESYRGKTIRFETVSLHVLAFISG